MPAWVLPLIFLGFSAGLSNFGGAVGLGILPLEKRHRREILVAFTSMEVLAPAIGLVLGGRVSGAVGARANLFAGVVLILIGAYTLFETRRETRDLEIPVKRRTFILLAVALSLDNLVVGFGLGLLGAPLLVAIGFMGLSSLVLTLVGLELGKHVGRKLGDRAELFSGLVLVAAGAFVLIHH
ncbi:MAG: manganese efflux pump MntP family protein [Candidatus Dormibacteria bacterium]